MVDFKGLMGDQSGAAAVQHALVAGALTLVVLAGSLALREPLIDLYDGVSQQAGEALIAAEPAFETDDQTAARN